MRTEKQQVAGDEAASEGRNLLPSDFRVRYGESFTPARRFESRAKHVVETCGQLVEARGRQLGVRPQNVYKLWQGKPMGFVPETVILCLDLWFGWLERVLQAPSVARTSMRLHDPGRARSAP